MAKVKIFSALEANSAFANTLKNMEVPTGMNGFLVGLQRYTELSGNEKVQ